MKDMSEVYLCTTCTFSRLGMCFQKSSGKAGIAIFASWMDNGNATPLGKARKKCLGKNHHIAALQRAGFNNSTERTA